jgi:prepilin-type N-terminal cleavage/methylation domain-containing protein
MSLYRKSMRRLVRYRVSVRGFTLVELLVVLAIIGVLLGMSIPAMQNMRELARRSNCGQNLAQLSLALSGYSARNGHYPVGTFAQTGPIRSEPIGYHHNWIAGLLPMMDATNVYDAVDQNVSVYDAANDEVRKLRIPMMQCPSASDIRDNSTCYAGIHASTEIPIDEDNDGVFRLNLPVSDSDITDGLAHTLFLGEKLSPYEEDLGWISGTRSSLRNTGHPINAERLRVRGAQSGNEVSPTYVGGLASDHPGGCHLLLGSGQYDFRSASIDLRVLQQLASRADGGIPIEWKSQQPLDDRIEADSSATAGSSPTSGTGTEPVETSDDADPDKSKDADE